MRNLNKSICKIEEYDINLSLPSHAACYLLYRRYALVFAGSFSSETMLVVIENLVPVKMTHNRT